MHELEEIRISCPYCGEMLDLLLDCSADEQAYVEDCQVCCRPLHISYTSNADGVPVDVVVRRDDE